MNLTITVTINGRNYSRHARNTAENRIAFIEEARRIWAGGGVDRVRVTTVRNGVTQVEWDSAIDGK